MTSRTRNRVLLGGLLSILATAFGCTGKNSLSSYARSGDTVMVSFGAVSDSPALRQDNLVASVTDSANATSAVKIRQVINLYPDPTSHVAAETGNGTADLTGLRTAVIDLVDPVTGVAPSLATGTANLTLKRTDNTVVASKITIQILSGVGTPHPFTEQVAGLNYTASLSARPQVRFRIKPVSTSYQNILGAVQFELHYPYSALADAPAETSWPQAVPSAADANLQFTSRYYTQGSDEVIKVLMVNPDGITNVSGTQTAAYYRGMSAYDSLRFSIVWGDATLQTSYTSESWFTASTISGATPILKVFDTLGNDVSLNFSVIQE